MNQELAIEPIYRRFWLWSAQSYARERGLLWVKVVVGYRHLVDGREVVWPSIETPKLS